MFDTGASNIIVCPALLGITLNGPPRLPIGSSVSGDAFGREVTLEVGNHVWLRRRVSVMDLASVLSAYKKPIDGVLGLDTHSSSLKRLSTLRTGPFRSPDNCSAQDQRRLAERLISTTRRWWPYPASHLSGSSGQARLSDTALNAQVGVIGFVGFQKDSHRIRGFETRKTL